ncbi:hypothetical protein ACFQ8C_06355 [Streptomyces sp. NPDC056503]|uniref:hypothetical protein n=1 Tax=Streptomyces sp. NPDC056503 TaxID=3345842 RepID=UPI0036CD3708
MGFRRPWGVAVSLALVSLLVAGCGGAAEPPVEVEEPVPDRTSAGTGGGTGASEPSQREREEERAVAAVDAISLEEAEFAESGAQELTAEGVHIRSQPVAGEAYHVIVACAGTGAVRVVVGGQAPASVPCDGVAVSRRVQSAPAELPLAITAVGGAAGAVAWRIESVAAEEDDGGTVDPDPELDDDDADHPVGKPRRKVRR